MTSNQATAPSVDDVRKALATVQDPEIRRPITDLGMVKDVTIDTDGTVTVAIYLTVAGCPLRDKITADVTAAVTALGGVRAVKVDLDVMTDDQRTELRRSLRGDTAEPVIPFAQPGSLTRVY
ncbi:MAG TPA: metal-sulfur cluster assembly factor, partial [Pseudonocardiaceae bacterium]